MSQSRSAKRLAGLDIFRVLAAYGVVFIHGLGGDVPRDALTTQVSSWFSTFCVPFFLALSFWLLDKRIQQAEPKALLPTRTRRVMTPFFCWSVIYLAARLGKQLLTRDQSFNKLISDPISLLFGAAGVQLYFLPMLLVGTIAAILVGNFFKGRKSGAFIFLLLFAVSVVLKVWLVVSGNTFDRGAAFQELLGVNSVEKMNGLLRIISVIVAWVIACLPYVLFSSLLNQWLLEPILKPAARRIGLISCAIVLLLSIPLTIYFKSFPINDLIMAYSALIFGILISHYLTGYPWLETFSKASFGVYLVHGLFTDGLAPVLQKVAPFLVVDTLSLPASISYSLVIFGISFACTQLIASNHQLKRLFLGD